MAVSMDWSAVSIDIYHEILYHNILVVLSTTCFNNTVRWLWRIISKHFHKWVEADSLEEAVEKANHEERWEIDGDGFEICKVYGESLDDDDNQIDEFDNLKPYGNESIKIEN